jgi:hypothetical protein
MHAVSVSDIVKNFLLPEMEFMVIDVKRLDYFAIQSLLLADFTASTDTLTASKTLSRPLQSISTQLACNWELTSTFSRL